MPLLKCTRLSHCSSVLTRLKEEDRQVFVPGLLYHWIQQHEDWRLIQHHHLQICIEVWAWIRARASGARAVSTPRFSSQADLLVQHHVLLCQALTCGVPADNVQLCKGLLICTRQDFNTCTTSAAVGEARIMNTYTAPASLSERPRQSVWRPLSRAGT